MSDAETRAAISASLMRMAARSAFFATLALYAPLEITERVPTAATDGKKIYVNPVFLSSLSAPEQDGVLLHEVLHAALLHVPRRGGRDPQLWNIAADIVVNGIIRRHGYPLPDSAVVDDAKAHLGVEEVYELLRRAAERPAPAPEDLLAGPPQPAGTPQPGPGAGEQAGPGADVQPEDYWRNAREQAQVVARSTSHGELPAGLERELGQLKPGRLDWRAHLWRYLTAVPTDFTGFDRRFVGRGMYLETLSGESARVLVAVDTSGSIDLDEVTLFLGEVQAILLAYPMLRCELFYADTALYGPYPLAARSPIPPPLGGGGTDFRPFFAAATGHSYAHDRTLAIYLTDGWGEFPDQPPRLPTLWVITPGGRDQAAFPFGETVRL